MPMPGYVFKDGGPIPDDEMQAPPPSVIPLGDSRTLSQSQTRQPSTPNSSSVLNTPTSSASTSHAPTESHALANADHDLKGAAQLDHYEPEVKDLGWNEHPEKVPAPLVGNLPNEELWTLVRRFNKVRPKGLDCTKELIELLTLPLEANVSCQSNPLYSTWRS